VIVIDASAILEILGRTAAGLELEKALTDLDLHAPHVIDLEVINAVRRWETLKVVKRAEAMDVLEAFRAFRITRYSHTPLLDSIWALRHNLTACDAAYLALARALGAELVTMDSGLGKMAARQGPRVNFPV
jgi:predicted nucleic acid-binding protein